MNYAVLDWKKTIITSHLTPKARLVAFVLSMRMNRDGVCWPSVATIAKDAGCSEMTVHRAVKELRDSAYLTVTYRGRGPVKQQSNVYEMRVPPWRYVTLRQDDPDAPIPF